jgi:hypothetical protein
LDRGEVGTASRHWAISSAIREITCRACDVPARLYSFWRSVRKVGTHWYRGADCVRGPGVARDSHLTGSAASFSLSSKSLPYRLPRNPISSAQSSKSLWHSGLQPLCRLARNQRLCFQQNTASFCKTTGVGVSTFKQSGTRTPRRVLTSRTRLPDLPVLRLFLSTSSELLLALSAEGLQLCLAKSPATPLESRVCAPLQKQRRGIPSKKRIPGKNQLCLHVTRPPRPSLRSQPPSSSRPGCFPDLYSQAVSGFLGEPVCSDSPSPFLHILLEFPSSSGCGASCSLRVHYGFADLRQLGVRLLLFLQRLLQERGGVLQSKVSGK